MSKNKIRTFTAAEWAFLFSADHKFTAGIRVGIDPEFEEVPLPVLVESYDWLFATAEDYLNMWGNQEINQQAPNNPLGTNANRVY